MVREKFKEKRFVGVILLALTLLLTLTGNFLPQVQGTMTASNFVTEITTLGSLEAYVIDVDSSGNIYLYEKGDNDIYKSTDQGVTWTKVLDKGATTSYSFLVFVDSRNCVYCQTCRTAVLYDFWRSTDGGSTWTNLGDSYRRFWHMTEDSNGYLYVNTYSSSAYIYRSTDEGATFSVWYNLTGQVDHFHSVGVDIANDDIYISTGDWEGSSYIQRYNGSTWSNITWWEDDRFLGKSSLNDAQPTDIWSDGTYVYFAPDGSTRVNRIVSGGSWSTKETVLDLKYAPQPLANFAFEAVRYSDGVVLMGTEDGQLWGSWDGERWVKLIDTENASDSFFSISNRRPIYVTNRNNGKLYRINIQKEDLIHLFYKQHYISKGSLTNAENYVLEQRIWNSTNYVDLTNVVLTDVQASIIGLNRSNWQVNSGFETGDKTGWSETTAPLGVIRSDSPVNGTYYYARNHTASTSYLWTRENTYVSASEGDVTLLSYYIKSNASQADAYQILYHNGDGVQWSYTFNVTTSWVRRTHYYVFDNADTQGKWYFRFLNYPLETCIDSVMYQYLEVGIHLGRANQDSIVFSESFLTGEWDGSNKTTTNASITINSQTISHSDSLANGTESSATNLTGTLTGAVEVSANIQGSGQAILKLNGTRVLYEDSIILKGRTQNVYYGRYYGMLSLTTNTTDLLALTNLQANITSLSFDGSKLTLIVHSPSGTTSTTKVHCGDKGEPTAVYATNGTLSWNYNASTKMLTSNVAHEGSANILVDWRIPGDVNGDGIVDIFDIGAVSAHWYPGPPVGPLGYDVNCDINNDGAIDLFDICICCDHWAEAC